MNHRTFLRCGLKQYMTSHRVTRAFPLLLIATLLLTAGFLPGMRPVASAETATGRVLDCPYTPKQGEGYAGFYVHQHNEDCFDDSGELVCPLPEIPYHIHDAGCFEQRDVLVCGKEGRIGHAHSILCYDLRPVLTCTLKETVLHQHDDSCYTTDADGKRVLTCGLPELEEHIHSDACFRALDELEEGHVPLAAPEEPVTEEQTETENLAESEPEPAESANETTTKELPGEEITKTQGTEDISDAEAPVEQLVPNENETEPLPGGETIKVLEEEAEPASETVSPEESPVLIFMTEEETGAAEELQPETPKTDTEAEAKTDTEAEEIDEKSDADGDLPAETDTDMPAQRFAGSAVGVRVEVEADEGTFPAKTTMVLTPVSTSELPEDVNDAVEGAVVQVHALDISFYGPDGEELEPLKPIRVTMRPEEAPAADNQAVVRVDKEGDYAVIAEQNHVDSTGEISFETESVRQTQTES